MPHHRYTALDMPRMTFGFPAGELNQQPASELPQKRAYYQQWMLPVVQSHQPRDLLRVWLREKLPLLLEATLPFSFLVILLPLGLLSSGDARIIPLLGALPMFVFLYALFPYLLPHYILTVAPPVILALLLGLRQLENCLNRWRFAPTVLVLGACVAGMVRGYEGDDIDRSISTIEKKLKEVHAPAVVLFRYHPNDTVHAEPVYNVDTLWPDDAAIVRAHDLGEPRNEQIVRYYWQRLPRRNFYLYDRRDHSLRLLTDNEWQSR